MTEVDDRLWHVEYPIVLSEADLSDVDGEHAGFLLTPEDGVPLAIGERLALIDNEGFRIEVLVATIHTAQNGDGSYKVKDVIARPLPVAGIGVTSLEGGVDDSGIWKPVQEEWAL